MRRLVALLAMPLLGVVLWVLAALRPSPARPPAQVRMPAVETGLEATGPLTSASEARSAPTSVHAADRNDSATPHPLTPERERIQKELRLIAALNDAVDLRDVTAIRALLATYRAHDPSDEHRLQEGYQSIADCLQHPGGASRSRAQQYYERERASTLRRYVRRACFE